MRKTTYILLLLFLSMFFLSGCGNEEPIIIESEGLEFNITQNVEDVDFGEYDEIYGWFGAREFLGKGYKAVVTDGSQGYPEYYVSYLITAYPDYSDGGQFVTQIKITDPAVSIFGLNVFSSASEFSSVMKSKGFEVKDAESTSVFCKGKVTISSFNGKISIRVEISNKNGIVF